MNTFTLTGHVNERHLLSAQVPESIPPGPVTVVILPQMEEDEAGAAWMAGVAREWTDELTDVRQDIYTLEDGAPVDAS